MTAPLVSIVIPSYNHARYVRAAIDSVLGQDTDLELIVVDDGSTDESREVIGAVTDPRLRLILQENRGAHAAINRGLTEARGHFLGILNSDDRYAAGRLARAVDLLCADEKLGLVGSHIALMDEDGARLSVKHGYDDLDPWPVGDPASTFKADRDLKTALLLQNYWATTSNYVMPRRTFERHGPFRPLRYCHDWDFALRVQLDEPAALIPEPLLEYRVHGANTIREDTVAMVYEVCWTLALHVPRYLAQPSFWAAGRERRALQLLRSIHVYGCERAFWHMAAHIASAPGDAALALLSQGDPVRALYLDDIRRVLEQQPITPAGAPGGWRRLVARLRTAWRP
jgi:glycosyltransferase involved in cell wall biosynthesis